MSEEKNTPHLIDEVKDLLPEIDFAGIEAATESREQMQARLDVMEKNLQSLTDVLGETVKLYEATKKEAKILKDHHLANITASSKATVDVAETMMNMLTIDYARLAHPLVEQGIIDKMGLTKTLKEAIEETAGLEGFVEKVAIKVASQTDFDIDYEDLAGEIDMGDLMAYLDPTDYWDSSEIAEYFSTEDIAYHVDMDEVSNNIDTGEVANCVDMEDLSNHVDAGEVAKGIDLDALAEKVKELMEAERNE